MHRIVIAYIFNFAKLSLQNLKGIGIDYFFVLVVSVSSKYLVSVSAKYLVLVSPNTWCRYCHITSFYFTNVLNHHFRLFWPSLIMYPRSWAGEQGGVPVQAELPACVPCACWATCTRYC